MRQYTANNTRTQGKKQEEPGKDPKRPDPVHQNPNNPCKEEGEDCLDHEYDWEVFDTISFEKGSLSKIIDQNAADPHDQLYDRYPEEKLDLIGVDP